MDIRSDSLVLGLGIGIVGVSFGVLAGATGLPPLQACAMSALVFTGASQFAAVGVIGAGGSPLAAVATGLLLGARNAGYGLYVSSHLHGHPLLRALEAHLTIDESTAMAAAHPDQPRRGFLWAGLSIFVAWNLGTLIGVLSGEALDPHALGLDVALPAAFLALLVPHLGAAPGRWAAIAGATVALVATPLTAAGVPILLAASGALVALRTSEP
ncbi:MAG: AzlC family ABC transporter permease [Actinomycetota bacterium]